jgi:putrescine transport system ATP-binding protein
VSNIRLEGVTKRYGSVTAADNVDLTVAQGEFVTILGPSGSGKTTLLSLIAGLNRLTEGRIFIGGREVTNAAAQQRNIGLVFQSYALFPHMSVEQNIAFGLEQERLGKAEIRRRVGEMLEVVKMGGYEKRKPHQLSGGQRQRIALARALVKRPRLLLLDEPLGALDRKLREHTQFELLNIQKQLGITFIVVTHDQEEAMVLSTRIGVMNQGRIEQVGTASEIYEQPATRFIADFIGSVNLFEGEVLPDDAPRADAAQRRIRCEGLGMVRTGYTAVGGASSKVWVALRPEKISMEREASPVTASADAGAAGAAGVADPRRENVSQDNTCRGTVREIAYLGGASVYLIALAGSARTVRVTLPNDTREIEHRIGRGESVLLSWDVGSPVVLTE